MWAWAGVAAVILVLAGIAFAAIHAGDGDAQSAGQQPGKSSASGTATPDSGVRCGDGSTSTSYKSCRLPAGSVTMREVFPSFDGACRADSPNRSAPNEIAPTFRCTYPDFEVRYSTWRAGANPGRLEYLNLSYGEPDPDAPQARADVRVWEALDTARSLAKSSSMPFVWAAAYAADAGKPYSVIVKAATKADLERGITYVRLSS